MKTPNLELILFKANEVLGYNQEFLSRIRKAERTLNLAVYTFPQMWGSTALGFGGIGGQAMTEAYTTVVRERVTNSFVIFFGERPCYSLTDPTEEFFEDLRNLSIAGIDEAMERYKKDEES